MITVGVKDRARAERVFASIEDAPNTTRRAIRQAWFDLGIDLKSAASAEILRKPKGGRVYVVRGPGGRRRRHVASAPGETHANLTGRLRRSISWKVHGTDSMRFGYGVSTRPSEDAPRYDEYVEFGTRRMEPRPSLDNAISEKQRDAERNFLDSMDRAFREFTG